MPNHFYTTINNLQMRTILLFILLLTLSSVNAQKTIQDYTIIGDSTNFYKSIDDILMEKEFQNKVVYVDIWGTRCPPCIKEFAFIPELKKQFKNDSIVFLYLCSPYTVKWDNENAELWKKLILKYNLNGINILMSSECYEDGFFEKYKEHYTPRRQYGIPTYLLVDKTGKIVNFDAPRPSKKEILYDEIRTLLHTN